MLVGVVSDTHNNIKNINLIISIFNQREVELVIHTGDITKESTLKKFLDLNCDLVGVFGNNDRNEPGLERAAEECGFEFHQPPFKITKFNRNIAIFHEPELINEYLSKNKDIDIALHGHTHRYREEIKEKTIFFNPGESAGMIKGKNAIGIINLKDLSLERIFF